jgi:hypothetical protein
LPRIVRSRRSGELSSSDSKCSWMRAFMIRNVQTGLVSARRHDNGGDRLRSSREG